MAEGPHGEQDPILDLKDRIAYEFEQGETSSQKSMNRLASLIHERLEDHMSPEMLQEFWEGILEDFDRGAPEGAGHSPDER